MNFDLNVTERAQMFLAHAGAEAEALAPLVHDMAPVVSAFEATREKISGRVPTLDVVQIYVPHDTESELQRVIEKLELRKSVEEHLSPGEFYKELIFALVDHIEDMMVDVYGLIVEARPPWISGLIELFENQFLSGEVPTADGKE